MSADSSSPLQLFRAYPRAVVFQLALFPAAFGVGMVVYAKLMLATQHLGGVTGLGQMALVFSLSCAAAAVAGGPLADRFSARWLNGLALMVCGVGVALLGAVLHRLTAAEIHGLTLAVVCVEGVTTGLQLAAQPVVLAALVAPAHRGAADLIAGLRAGLGVLAGMQVAQFIPDLHLSFVATGASLILSGVLAIAVSPPALGRQGERFAILSFGPVLRSLRQLPLLRRLVGTDLLLKLAIPTQLGALYLADLHVQHQAGLIFGAGLMGVLLANAWLTLAPAPAALGQSLRRYFSIFLLLSLVAPWLLIDAWLVGVPWLAALLLLVGSFVSSATESLVRSAVQQEVPDEIRGRISGALGATRNVLSAVFGALHAGITHVTDISWLLAGLFLAGGLVWIFTRGFSVFDRPGYNVRARV